MMGDIFFHEKGKRVLLTLKKHKEQNITEISREIDGTYAHTFNILKEMERLGIIKSNKTGRTKHVKLTPKGERLAKIIKDFDNTLKKKVKKATVSRTTPTHEKLEKYLDSLESISSEISSKKLKKGDIGKYSRVLGRYKSLVGKLRPRDKAGKKQKKDTLSIIEKTYLVLKK